MFACLCFRNALNIVKDDLIAKVDELSRLVDYERQTETGKKQHLNCIFV